MTFCTDTDLLHFEPNICRDAAFASQTLMSGSGNLSATTFTIASGSFTASHIAAGQVLVFTGDGGGSFPIVSVDSATQLTVSVLFEGLQPESGPPIASPVGAGTALAFVIRTFWPQRRVVSELLEQAAGLDPAQDNAAKILNADALCRPCVLGTLQMIYNALAAAAEDDARFNVREQLYEKLYRRALRSARVELDLDGDGAVEIVRPLNVLQLQRV